MIGVLSGRCPRARHRVVPGLPVLPPRSAMRRRAPGAFMGQAAPGAQHAAAGADFVVTGDGGQRYWTTLKLHWTQAVELISL